MLNLHSVIICWVAVNTAAEKQQFQLLKVLLDSVRISFKTCSEITYQSFHYTTVYPREQCLRDEVSGMTIKAVVEVAAGSFATD